MGRRPRRRVSHGSLGPLARISHGGSYSIQLGCQPTAEALRKTTPSTRPKTRSHVPTTNAHDGTQDREVALPNKLPIKPSSSMWRLLPLLTLIKAQQLVYKYNVSCDNATNTLVKDERRDPATGEWVGECVLLRPAWPS